ncbi:sugar efflux transporter [Neobacillus niacini]|uniref:sugar efflux transporter n=1 Tax=Neobacillus niacini TaxID=86668 RepID=UPI003B028007
MKKPVFSILKENVLFVWRIPSFPVLFLLNFNFGLSTSFFVPFSSLFGIDEVGMSNTAFGFFMTLLAIGGVSISSLIAKRSDTSMSRKRLLILTSLTGVLGYTCFAFLRNYFALAFTAFFLLGATAASVPQLWAYARDILRENNIPSSKTPLIMNVFRMFFALSWTVGPALGAWLLLTIGFKGLFLMVAASHLLALLTIVFLLKDVAKQVLTDKDKIKVTRWIVKPHIFVNLAAALLLSAATSIHMLNMPQFVTKVLNGSEMDVGVIFSVPPVFEVPMMIAIGVWATRTDNALLVKIGYGLAFTYFLLLGFVTEPWQIYPLQLISAAHVSITAGLAISYFQDFIPEAPGTATTLYMNVTKIGSTVGYLLFGLFSEFISYENMINIYSFFAGVGFLIFTFFGNEKIKSSKGKPKVQEL